MFKHSISLLVASLATTALAGCQLYFGEDDQDDSWTYCGSDGYYECYEEDCYWRGPECPAGMDPNGQPPGFECDADNDCAAGCYCGNGICEEAGFCTSDADCGPGYTCDESRSSCTTDDEPTPTSCMTDAECPTGSYCSPDTYTCTATCTCTTDAEATAQNYAYCDEGRSTCLPGEDYQGDCVGEVTCNFGRPSCPEGQVAKINEGCYTGECQAINTCGTAPGCEAFGHASDCNAAGCSSSYTGLNCRSTDGLNTPCDAMAANCTCESYTFAACTE
jgi:hypothetical protein